MDKNSRLYGAASYLYQAAVLLDGVKPDLKIELLDKADELAKEIKIDQGEINEVLEYKKRIKDI